MQVFDDRVYEIIEKGLEGNGLTREETKYLLDVPQYTPETAYIRWAGQKLSLECTGGIAEIHGQIGLNSTKCPMNCGFCSFAKCSSARVEEFELTREDVLEYAKIHIENGVNLLLLLCTASYRFDKLLEMAQATREVIPADMPLLVNCDDLTLERCKQLKAVGVNGAYHAARMGEGVDTRIPVEKRMKTFEHLRDAGMTLSTCVEPVGPEHSSDEIVEAIFRCDAQNPVSAGAARRVGVPGTPLYERGMITEVRNADLVAIYRLAVGSKLRLNCSANTVMTAASGANLAWTELGLNPRDAKSRTEHGGRANNMMQCIKTYKGAGWDILEGPSPGWMI